MTSATTIILVLYFIQGSLGHALPKSPIVGIIGGHPVNITDVPFMAALLYIRQYSDEPHERTLCGGSIIHKQFVLTSGYCSTLKSLIGGVRVGSPYYDEGGQLLQIEKFITHESFSREDFFINNVGLLKLSEPITFGPTVTAIKLADASDNIPVGLTANVTGWGEIIECFKHNDPRELQQVSLTVSPLNDCINSTKHLKLTDKQICVNNDPIGLCLGDHGAPLIAGNLQIGILIDGGTCWNYPNVFEKVAPHLLWIRSKIRQNL